MRVHWTVSPQAVGVVLAAFVLGLTSLSLGARLVGSEALFGLDYEANVPTWYAAMTLALSAFVLAAIGGARRAANMPFARHWLGLAAVFLYLSLDELARIHDRLSDFLRGAFDTSGFLLFPWVVPAALVVSLLALTYAGWLRALPPRTRWTFVAAAALFLGGALGVEVFTAVQADAFGKQALIYVLLSHLEEFLEMSGVAVFLTGLVHYARSQGLQVRLAAAPDEPLSEERAA